MENVVTKISKELNDLLGDLKTELEQEFPGKKFTKIEVSKILNKRVLRDINKPIVIKVIGRKNKRAVLEEDFGFNL